jgi:glycosyltransferase involved in cell wall biosynthesis
MRVLYFHQHFTTPAGAGGTRSYEMARRLVAAGHSVTMVCGSYGTGETGLAGAFVRHRREGCVDGIDVIEFDLSYSNHDGLIKRSATFLRYSLAAMRVAMRKSYDIGFATTTPLTAGIPSILAKWFRDKPYVFEVRDLWPELPRAMGVIRNPVVLKLLSALEWLSYRNATRCIALAPGIAEGIEARGVPAHLIRVVPNGCDMDIFASNTVPWRPEFIANEKMLAVFTGTHGVANGLDAVLAAAQELQRRGRDDIAILLVGDGKEKQRLQAKSEAMALQNLHFHAPMSKRKLASLLAGADLGLQILANVPAFYFGTSPNKFFDYLAAGLPVLTNYPGWVANLVNEARAGFAVAPEDDAAFATALEAAADDREAMRAMGCNARSLARSKFDREKLGEDWVQWVVDGPCQ